MNEIKYSVSKNNIINKLSNKFLIRYIEPLLDIEDKKWEKSLGILIVFFSICLVIEGLVAIFGNKVGFDAKILLVFALITVTSSVMLEVIDTLRDYVKKNKN